MKSMTGGIIILINENNPTHWICDIGLLHRIAHFHDKTTELL